MGKIKIFSDNKCYSRLMFIVMSPKQIVSKLLDHIGSGTDELALGLRS